MTDVIMPQMGESIAEGTITKWLKQVGDTVDRDEPLFEISTDKVDAEIPAPAAGILKEIRVQPGATVAINTVVGVIEAAGAAAAPAPPATDPTPAPAPPPAPAAASPQPAPAAAPAAPPVAPPAPSAPPPTAPSFAPPPTPATPPPPPASAPAAERSRSELTVEELRQTRSSPVVRKI